VRIGNSLRVCPHRWLVNSPDVRLSGFLRVLGRPRRCTNRDRCTGDIGCSHIFHQVHTLVGTVQWGQLVIVVFHTLFVHGDNPRSWVPVKLLHHLNNIRNDSLRMRCNRYPDNFLGGDPWPVLCCPDSNRTLQGNGIRIRVGITY
jgi:hypothetical protein